MHSISKANVRRQNWGFITFDWLRFEKIVRHPLDISRNYRFCVLDRLRQVLQDHTAWQIRKSLFEGSSLMSRTATNIHKEGLFRRPAFGFLFKRINTKAFGLGPPLCFHKEIEASTSRWIAMNEVKCDQVGFVAPLENAVCETGRVLVAGLRQIARHFLKCWVASVIVELDPGLYLGFCEVECVFIWSIRVFANFVDHSQCRQVSQKTIYTNIRILAA